MKISSCDFAKSKGVEALGHLRDAQPSRLDSATGGEPCAGTRDRLARDNRRGKWLAGAYAVVARRRTAHASARTACPEVQDSESRDRAGWWRNPGFPR